MSNKEFLLFLNANGIYYKVCKKLKGTDGVIATVILSLLVAGERE